MYLKYSSEEKASSIREQLNSLSILTSCPILFQVGFPSPPAHHHINAYNLVRIKAGSELATNIQILMMSISCCLR